MAPLADYPNRPSVGEEGGLSGWPAKREQYDEAVEANIQAAYDLADDAKSQASSASTAASEAATAASEAADAADAASTAAASKVATEDVAGLNDLGWARAIFIPKDSVVPTGLPAYTLVVEA
jgi:hypothetical protein